MRRLPMLGTFDFTVIPEPQQGGSYTTSMPALPEVVTEGDTEEEALAMAQAAIRAILEFRLDHGIPIPADASVTVRTIAIAA